MSEEPWPGDPGSAWARAASAAPVHRSGSIPVITSWEDLTRKGVAPPITPFVPLMIAAVVTAMVGGAIVSTVPPDDPTSRTVLKVLAGLILVGLAVRAGFVWHAHRGPAARTETMDRLRRTGIIGTTHPSSLRIHAGDGSDGTMIVVDVRTPAAATGRLLAAFAIWLDRLDADPEAASATRDRWQEPTGSPDGYPASEIFGPAAPGAFLVRRPSSDTGWALLLPQAKPRDPAHPWRDAHVTAIAAPGH